MRLFATIKNERGGKKSTGDNTRIQIELTHGNKIVGTIGLYSIIDDKVEGYRVVWVKPEGGMGVVIVEEEKAKAK